MKKNMVLCKRKNDNRKDYFQLEFYSNDLINSKKMDAF